MMKVFRASPFTAKEEVETELADRMLDNTAWDGSKVVRSAKVRMAWESPLSAAEVRKEAASLDNPGEEPHSPVQLSTLEQ